MNITEWDNCYPSNWKGKIVPEAMTHPAKFSSKLIRRIYEHLQDQGWVHPGDSVIDPFAGWRNRKAAPGLTMRQFFVWSRAKSYFL